VRSFDDTNKEQPRAGHRVYERDDRPSFIDTRVTESPTLPAPWPKPCRAHVSARLRGQHCKRYVCAWLSQCLAMSSGIRPQPWGLMPFAGEVIITG
jgi:hypothetical protein